MKRFHRVFIAAVVFAALIAAAAPPAFSAEAIKMGLVFSMTGGAAAYGATQKEGAELAVEQINAAAGGGLKIAPIFEDDASVPQQGTNGRHAGPSHAGGRPRCCPRIQGDEA